MSDSKPRRLKKLAMLWAGAAVLVLALIVTLAWWGAREGGLDGEASHKTSTGPAQKGHQDVVRGRTYPQETPDSQTVSGQGSHVQPSGTPTVPTTQPLLSENDNLFSMLIDNLKGIDNPPKRQAVLNKAAERLKTLEPTQATALVIDFLDSGEDFRVEMPFRVGIGGNLRSHTTLRVAALDWLGQFSPNEAKAYSGRIFDRSQSADEWALAFRNYGRQIEPGKDEYFSNRLVDLIANEEWSRHPSGGYAESFDAVVYNQDYHLMPDLLEMKQANPHLNLLMDMVVQSMVRNNREEAFEHVSDNWELLDAAPDLRVQIMSRVDVRSQTQLQLLHDYLADDNVSQDEKREFFRFFPRYGGFRGHRLLTTDHAYTLHEQAQHDVNSPLKNPS